MNLNNITSISTYTCCGCNACYESCPTQAIQMLADQEGFLYPVVDEKLCTNCGLCLRKCDNSKLFVSEVSHVYACWTKNMEIRQRSSSGGVFIDTADYCTKYNLRMLYNPVSPELSKRKAFYDDLDKLSFYLLSQKHLATIKEERKKRKLGIVK